jgi:hypothetical protein
VILAMRGAAAYQAFQAALAAPTTAAIEPATGGVGRVISA